MPLEAGAAPNGGFAAPGNKDAEEAAVVGMPPNGLAAPVACGMKALVAKGVAAAPAGPPKRLDAVAGVVTLLPATTPKGEPNAG